MTLLCVSVCVCVLSRDINHCTAVLLEHFISLRHTPGAEQRATVSPPPPAINIGPHGGRYRETNIS